MAGNGTPTSINQPKPAGDRALANTISGVARDRMLPICATPYNSVQIDPQMTTARPALKPAAAK